MLAKNIDIAEFFEQVAEEGKVKADFALHWITGELLRVLNWNKTSLDKVDIKAGHFIELLKMVEGGLITELQAKEILNKFVLKSFNPLNSEGKISDKKELENVVKKVIENNKKAVDDYKKGDEKIVNYLMGEVMKATNRRADYKISKSLLEKMLKAG